jgi:2-polyprenyl-3-methyl-5-hydroxy-6-metoxy-1,4-benzoquinol methylase
MGTQAEEIQAGERFEFGKNWARFLSNLSGPQIEMAVGSLRTMLGVETLAELTFLDVGCGSGLFSLAARKLGARVYSFDFDPHSVGCTQELRRRFFADDPDWTIEEGSALDPAYLGSLGRFDVVYSWGVLHHTGAMWQALGNVAPLVKPGGLLFIAIYNDQGVASRRWTTVKRIYNRSSRPVRFLLAVIIFIKQYWRSMVKDTLRLRPFDFIRNYEGKRRGMTVWRDLIDWVGGYPFEVAKPEQLFEFYQERGFRLKKLVTCGGTMGCVELVLRRLREQEHDD